MTEMIEQEFNMFRNSQVSGKSNRNLQGVKDAWKDIGSQLDTLQTFVAG